MDALTTRGDHITAPSTRDPQYHQDNLLPSLVNAAILHPSIHPGPSTASSNNVSYASRATRSDGSLHPSLQTPLQWNLTLPPLFPRDTSPLAPQHHSSLPVQCHRFVSTAVSDPLAVITRTLPSKPWLSLQRSRPSTKTHWSDTVTGSIARIVSPRHHPTCLCRRISCAADQYTELPARRSRSRRPQLADACAGLRRGRTVRDH